LSNALAYFATSSVTKEKSFTNIDTRFYFEESRPLHQLRLSLFRSQRWPQALRRQLQRRGKHKLSL